jgi:hypothetical protein
MAAPDSPGKARGTRTASNADADMSLPSVSRTGGRSSAIQRGFHGLSNSVRHNVK